MTTGVTELVSPLTIISFRRLGVVTIAFGAWPTAIALPARPAAVLKGVTVFEP